MTHRPKHRTLVERLSLVLWKLNQGERVTAEALALEFNAHVRTVQRDLNERFDFLDLRQTDGTYALNPARLGRLKARDIERFAALAGVRGLFPSFSEDFLRDILDIRVGNALLVKGHQYEDLGSKHQTFVQLQAAVVERRHVSFTYGRPGNLAKSYAEVEPYKLVNHKGIWYLAARQDGRAKTFSFARIERLLVASTSFTPDPVVEARVIEDDGIWFGEDHQLVTLSVSGEVAGYFRRRKLIANQVIKAELPDGGLTLSVKVGHLNQLLPIVRYWIPHLRVLSPRALQDQLEQELARYCDGREVHG